MILQPELIILTVCDHGRSQPGSHCWLGVTVVANELPASPTRQVSPRLARPGCGQEAESARTRWHTGSLRVSLTRRLAAGSSRPSHMTVMLRCRTGVTVAGTQAWPHW